MKVLPGIGNQLEQISVLAVCLKRTYNINHCETQNQVGISSIITINLCIKHFLNGWHINIEPLAH